MNAIAVNVVAIWSKATASGNATDAIRLFGMTLRVNAMVKPMKTLSIRQPWASLIVNGIKPIENRTWKHLPKAEPQWLAIHASQKPDGDAATFVRDSYQIEALPLGAIVGAVYWHSTYDRKTCPKALWRSEWINHDCNVFLVFEKAVMIEPYPAKGRLGYWTCPEDAEKRIQEAIRCGL